MVGVEMRLGFPQGLVQTAQRRAAIARDKARGVEAGGFVAPALDQRQEHQRLDAGKIDAAGMARVFVFEGNLAQGFGGERELRGSVGCAHAISPKFCLGSNNRRNAGVLAELREESGVDRTKAFFTFQMIA